VYCVYALGKEAMREGRFAVALSGQHRKWLERWNVGEKDYVDLKSNAANVVAEILKYASDYVEVEEKYVEVVEKYAEECRRSLS
jgi:hypothetical protein